MAKRPEIAQRLRQMLGQPGFGRGRLAAAEQGRTGDPHQVQHFADTAEQGGHADRLQQVVARCYAGTGFAAGLEGIGGDDDDRQLRLAAADAMGVQQARGFPAIDARHADVEQHQIGMDMRHQAQRFDAERWMDWQQTTFGPSGRDAFWQLIRIAEPERDMKKVEASIASTEILLDRLEQHLSKNVFIAGANMTMADIPLTCEVHRWYGLPIPHKSRPYIEAWYAKMLARPGAKNVLTLPLS